MTPVAVLLVAGLGAVAMRLLSLAERRRALARLHPEVEAKVGRGSAVAAAGGPRRWLMDRWSASRRDRAIERALPDALDDIAGAVRSGSSLADAIAAAAEVVADPLRHDLVAVRTAVERGAPLTEALQRWADRRPLPPIRLAVAGLQLAADVGGAQAGALEDVAATVRDRIAVRDDLRAASTQARASAVVLAVAPLGFAAFSGLVDPRTLASTVAHPAGAASLVAGVGLDLAGGWWMLRLSGADR